METSRMRTCPSLVALLALLGCENELNVNRVSITDEFDQAPSNVVDILWVIDDSTSMKDEQAAVKAAAADFVAELEAADMDFQLGVITTDADSVNPKAGQLLGTPTYLTSECRADGVDTDCTYDTDFPARMEQGTGGSDQEKGLEAVLRAISPPLSETFNAGFIRPGALFMAIVLTDENDCSDGGRLGPEATGEDCYNKYDELLPVGDLVAGIKDAKEASGGGEVVMSGIIGPDAVENCDFAVPGKRYAEAIAILGGVKADICLADYSPVMQSLGLAATGILNTFQLSHAADTTSLEVVVTPKGGEATVVSADDVNGYTYLEDYAQIQFNGTSVPEREAKIEVTYYSAGRVPDPPSEDAPS